MHNNPCFNLLILHNNSFHNQGSKINKKKNFFTFRHTVFYKNFVPTTIYIYKEELANAGISWFKPRLVLRN